MMPFIVAATTKVKIIRPSEVSWNEVKILAKVPANIKKMVTTDNCPVDPFLQLVIAWIALKQKTEFN